jgi:hypothetical protein
MTDEIAKTQIAERFLTKFRSRDWALWKSIMLPGVWLTGIESSRPTSQDSGSPRYRAATLQILLRMGEMNFIPRREK